jgi:hypothetical protein
VDAIIRSHGGRYRVHGYEAYLRVQAEARTVAGFAATVNEVRQGGQS